MVTIADTVGASLDELARIGGAPDGGVTRVAWSDALFAAYDWAGERMRELGLEVEIDAAGNLLGRWHAARRRYAASRRHDAGSAAPAGRGSTSSSPNVRLMLEPRRAMSSP